MTRSDAASETGSPVVVLSGGGGGARRAGAERARPRGGGESACADINH